MRIKIILIL